MSKRRAIIVAEFEMPSELGGDGKDIATYIAKVADDLRYALLAKGLKAPTSVGAVVDAIPRRNDRVITASDLNNVVFRGIGTKHKNKDKSNGLQE